MNALRAIALSLLAIYAHQSMADTQSNWIEVGGKAVSIPAPIGFHEISELSEKMRDLAESTTPPEARLLAFFVSEEDFQRITKGESPEMNKYMVLHINRRLEHLTVSDADFSKLASQIKQEHHDLREKTKDITDPWLSALQRDSSEKLFKEQGLAVNLAVGEPVPLGVFLDQDSAVGYAQLVKIRFSIEGKQIDYLVVGGASLVKVSGKILLVNVNGKYENQNDLEWVRATSSAWVDQILATNLSHEPSKQAFTRSLSITRSDWTSVIEKAIEGGKGAIVLGLLAGLAILIVTALKRLFRKNK